MKLVNVVSRMRYKKDILKILSKIAPEILATKDVGKLVERLYNLGAIQQEEKTYLEIRLRAKYVCLMVEELFSQYGHDVDACMYLVDREKEYKYGKIVVLSAPHFPEDLVASVDGDEITPFNGVGCRAIVVNKVVEVDDVKTSPLYNDTALSDKVLKYGINSMIAFPIHYDDGEVIGSLIVNSRNIVEVCDELKSEVMERIENLEHVFTGLQQQWENKDLKVYKAVVSTDLIIRYADPELSYFFGYTPQNINGRMSYCDFVDEVDKRNIQEKVVPAIEEHRSARITVGVKKKGKNIYIPLEILFAPVRDTDGGLRFYEAHMYMNTKSCKEVLEKTAL